jgi:hypothetical protein
MFREGAGEMNNKIHRRHCAVFARIAVAFVLGALAATPSLHRVNARDAAPRVESALLGQTVPNCEVSPGGIAGGSYASIQAAINNPACATIFIYNFPFTESLTISRSVSISGAAFTPGALQTLIYPSGPGPVISVTKNVTVSLLKLQIVGNTGIGCTTAGGIVNYGVIKFEKVRVRNNACPGGVGGVLNQPGAVFQGDFFEAWDNSGGGANGAGGMLNLGTVNISGTAFLRNAHVTGAGSGIGGGVHNRGVMSLTHSSIISNVASSGAGIANTAGGSMWLVSTTIGDNRAHRGGGFAHTGSGLYADGGTTRLWFNTFVNNRYLAAQNGAFEDGAGATVWKQSGAVEANSTILYRVPVVAGGAGNCQGVLTATGVISSNFDSDGSCGVGTARSPIFDPAKPLGFNGGQIYVPQYTIWPARNSPTLNAADNTLCGHPLMYGSDVLGEARFSDSVCDIGSLEMPWNYAGSQPPTATPSPTVQPTATPITPTATSATPLPPTGTPIPTATRPTADRRIYLPIAVDP